MTCKYKTIPSVCLRPSASPLASVWSTQKEGEEQKNKEKKRSRTGHCRPPSTSGALDGILSRAPVVGWLDKKKEKSTKAGPIWWLAGSSSSLFFRPSTDDVTGMEKKTPKGRGEWKEGSDIFTA